MKSFRFVFVHLDFASFADQNTLFQARPEDGGKDPLLILQPIRVQYLP